MKLLGYIFGGFLLATTVFAQVDTTQFAIRVFTGEDTEPPTTPSLLSAIPVGPAQIDLLWSPATDNFAVGGYVVSRNGLPIATTTLTNFSDVGLLASTTYSYIVQAFDIAGNYSSSSNSVATTTLGLPPPPVVATSSQSAQTGSVTRVILDDLQITLGTTTAQFSIATARPARFEIRFGRTSAYELGYSVTETLTREYQTTLRGLEPGTVYEYEVIGYSPFGVPTILKRGQFTTLGNQYLFAPENVTRLVAVAEGDAVQLQWELPAASTFSEVRVVRSHLGFPTTLQDGAVVYQGDGTSFKDDGVLSQYSPVYYTVFVIDENGRTSSGAVAIVYAITPGEDRSGVVPPLTIPPVVEITEAERVLPEFRMPLPEEIFVIQQEYIRSFGTQDLRLASNQPLVISIPKTAVAKNLKTIIATITDPADGRKSFSFLLRINNTDTAYEATLAPLNIVGVSQLTITIYDYEARVVGTRSQVLTFEIDRLPAASVVWPDYFVEHYRVVLSGLVLILLGVIMIVFYIRSRT